MSILNPDNILQLKELLAKWDVQDNYELEIRPGEYTKNGFQPQIPKEIYDKIFQIQRGAVKEERSITWSQPKVRMIKILDKNNKTISTRYEVKERKGVVDFKTLSLRINLATERVLDPKEIRANQFNFLRFRRRLSRISADGNWRFDFGEITEREFGNISEAGKILKDILSLEPEKYELEIEWIGKFDPEETLQSLIQQITDIALLLNDDIGLQLQKNIIYTEIYNLISEKNFALKSKSIDTLDMTRDLINKPATLQLSDLGKLEINPYSVTEKADGERHLLFIDSNSKSWLINSRNEVISFHKMKKLKNWLIDGELINDLFAAFDCLIKNEEDITDQDLKTRLEALAAIKKTNHFMVKKFYFGNIYKNSDTILKSKFPYNIDGLIMTPVEEPYRNQSTFKWKFPHLTTTDFLIRYAAETEFHLYVGISRGLFKSLGLALPDNYKVLFPHVDLNTNYFPVRFQPKEMPNAYIFRVNKEEVARHGIEDNTIVELSFNEKHWSFVKTREDKTKEYRKYGTTYGNAWKTAVNNLHAVLKPVTEDIIRGRAKAPFFTAETKKSNIIGMRKFHNYIKTQMYEKYTRRVKWLLEVAAGRFADLPRWIKNDIKNVVAFDLDKEALEEGLERLKMTEQKVPNVYSGVGDATIDWKLFLQRFNIKKGQFDVISIQFAMHFMLASEETFKQFVQNVHTYLKPKGILMASVIDGEKLMNLFKANNIHKGETYDIKKKTNTDVLTTIISIKKQCVCDELANTGQEISVFVESIGGYTKEYLVNLQYVIRTFQRAGFELVEEMPFENMYHEWRRRKPGMPLSDAEKIYSFLGNYLVLRKT
jgi:2-polyprenyl-3-methyl-5-hydroxy-6-metoxy-1,4-benzoquinol methylase